MPTGKMRITVNASSIPTGEVDEPLPSHIGRLIEIAGGRFCHFERADGKEHGASFLDGGIYRLYVRLADQSGSAHTTDAGPGGCIGNAL